MSITPLHPVIRNFFETLTFAENHYIAFIDLRLAAIGQAQLEIDKVCKIMVDGTDEFITVKIVGETSTRQIAEENLILKKLLL